jgi:hypothetical protein
MLMDMLRLSLSWLNQVFCMVMNDHGYASFVIVMVEPSMIIHYHTEYLVKIWLRQTKHIHDHSLQHSILGSTMTTTNGTYPWSFITTQYTWFNHDYDKWNISMIINYHTVYMVQLGLRQTEHIHDHSLPHSKLGSTMTTTNGTYPWLFITTQNIWFNHDYDKRNISMIIHYLCVVMNDHGYVSFVVVIAEPNILCGNEWSWVCSVCRSHSWTKYTVW